MVFKIGDHEIGGGNGQCYIIAEIGQNHQGNLELAKQLILSAKENGANCVKFQKSNLSTKFTQRRLQLPYNNPNSWGKTYDEHKKYLEFSIEQMYELRSYANSMGIDFSASAMDLESLKELAKMKLPFIKIGSGDANNIPLLELASSMDELNETPLVISTGMQTEKSVRQIIEIMLKNNKTNICLMHCISSYPTNAENVNLHMINLYRQWFPDTCIGYSGHEIGISISVAAAIIQGASIIERHFTLDKTQKGTDHKLSLEPKELNILCHHIRRLELLNISPSPQKINPNSDEVLNILKICEFSQVECNDILIALNQKTPMEKKIEECEKECYEKLGKSLVYRYNLCKDDILNESNIDVKVTDQKGVPPEQYYSIIGKKLMINVNFEDTIQSCDFC